MSLDVSALSAYVQNKRQEIAKKAVAKSKTADLLIGAGAFQIGVTSEAAILRMDADVTFQADSGCARTASGNVTLTDKKITVKQIKDIQNFCPKSMYNTFFASRVAAGSSPEGGFTPEFADQIMDLRASKIAAQVEKLIWQGDLALTGTTNMKYMDGLLKVIKAGSYVDLTSVATGSTIIAKLQNAYLGMNVDVRGKDDFRIFIGEDKHAEYTVALANANLYHPETAGGLFGTPAKFEIVPGLNGTGEVVFSSINNFHFGINGSDETDKAELRYSTETTLWYMDFYFSAGVQVIWPEEVGHFDLTA